MDLEIENDALQNFMYLDKSQFDNGIMFFSGFVCSILVRCSRYFENIIKCNKWSITNFGYAEKTLWLHSNNNFSIKFEIVFHLLNIDKINREEHEQQKGMMTKFWNHSKNVWQWEKWNSSYLWFTIYILRSSVASYVIQSYRNGNSTFHRINKTCHTR